MKKVLLKLSLAFTFCLLLGIIISSSVITVFATETKEPMAPENAGTAPTDSGNCGENVAWAYYANEAMLRISGTGKMMTYSYGYAPWYKYAANIKNVEIGEEISLISEGAFHGFESLEEITIPYVGKTRDFSTSKEQLFGYIFGKKEFNNSQLTEQAFSDDLSARTEAHRYTYDDRYSSGAGFITRYYYPYLKYSRAFIACWDNLPYGSGFELDCACILSTKKYQKRPAPDSSGSTWGYYYTAYQYSTFGEPADGYTVNYYIPTSLTTVNITNAKELYYGAFTRCKNILNINILCELEGYCANNLNLFYGTNSKLLISCLKTSPFDHSTYYTYNYDFAPLPPSAPNINKKTSNSISLVENEDFEYSMDGVNWQISPIFTGLSPNTEYKLYQRYREIKTNSYVKIHASLTSAPLTVKTYGALQSISIQNPPTILSYVIETDTLNVSGGTLLLHYENDEYAIIDMDASMVSGFDNSVLGTKSLIVKYQDKTTTFDVEIIDKKISNFAFYPKPSKTIYTQNIDSLDVTDGMLRVYYSNAPSEIVSITPDMISGFDNTILGKQTLTVNYRGLSLGYNIYVKYNPNTPDLPIVANLTSLEIAVEKNEGYEYRINGGAWSKNNIFTNLTPSTTYTVEQRIAETDFNYASSPSMVTVTTYGIYTVIFKNEDGTVLSTKTYHYGDEVTVPTTPTKDADNTYTYTFKAWDAEVVDCAGNATYTATYDSHFIDYTVIFKNEDGTELSTKTYHYGDAVAVPATPTKAADKTYTYTFKAWDAEVVNCAGNATYTATYNANYIAYTVIFKNEDGTVLSTKTYHYGNAVTAPTTPTKAADNTYTYTFKAWDKTVVNCAGNAVYTATYDSHFIDYTVIFKNEDGTELSTKTYHYGDAVAVPVPATPTKAADKTYTYTFKGWDKEVVDCVGNETYTATYDSHFIDYTVIFKNEDGTVLSTKTYHYGDEVTVPENPSKESDGHKYAFAGWDKDVVNCEGDAIYTATFETDGLSTGPIVAITTTSTVAAGTGGFSLFWFAIKKKRFADLIKIFRRK